MKNQFRPVRILTQIFSVVGVFLIVSGCSRGVPAEWVRARPQRWTSASGRYTTSEAVNSANKFLEAWKSSSYETMYNMLAAESKAVYSLEQFSQVYENVAD